jgi:hypothetical protein
VLDELLDGIEVEAKAPPRVGDLQTQMVKPGRVRVVWPGSVRRPDADLHDAVEVVRVGLLGDGLVTLEEAEGSHDPVVERL